MDRCSAIPARSANRRQHRALGEVVRDKPRRKNRSGTNRRRAARHRRARLDSIGQLAAAHRGAVPDGPNPISSAARRRGRCQDRGLSSKRRKMVARVKPAHDVVCHRNACPAPKPCRTTQTQRCFEARWGVAGSSPATMCSDQHRVGKGGRGVTWGPRAFRRAHRGAKGGHGGASAADQSNRWGRLCPPYTVRPR
jgi:hypothetical protein